MYNLHRYSNQNYQLYLNDEIASLTKDQISSIIKKKLKRNPAIRKLFNQFDISLDKLDNLRISIVPLQGKHAITDGKEMKLDENLFKKRYDFFTNFMFLPVHELVHHLSRIKEQQAYFNDPEEVLGFVAAIAYYMSEGKNKQQIWNDIFPRINWHFNDEKNAKLFFERCTRKAKQLI